MCVQGVSPLTLLSSHDSAAVVTEAVSLMASGVQAEINTWVVLSVALPGMTSDPTVMLPAASVGMLLAIGTAGLTVSSQPSITCGQTRQAFWVLHAFSTAQALS